jgi:hypothetical protein
MRWLRWFVAGALAVPLFHQVVFWALHEAELVDRAPWSMDPTRPFGVPSIISLSFWGGLWGLLLGFLLAQRRKTFGWWMTALLFGAVAPTLVALFVVMPLKGLGYGAKPELLAGGAMLNGAWGLGTALLASIFDRILRRPV